MTEHEARRAQKALSLIGIPCQAGPAHPDTPDGLWRLWDERDADDRLDMTLWCLDVLIGHLGGDPRDGTGVHGRPDGHQTRGAMHPAEYGLG